MDLRWTLAAVLALAACERGQGPQPAVGQPVADRPGATPVAVDAAAALADAPAAAAAVDAAPEVAASTDAAVAPDAAAAPAAAARGAGACSKGTGMKARSKRTFDEGHARKTVSVKLGELFTVELRNSPYRYGWEDEPKLDGGAIEFVGKDVVRPPPDVDGGSSQHLFRFCAKAKGRTKLRIESTGDEEWAPEDFRLVVKVE